MIKQIHIVLIALLFATLACTTDNIEMTPTSDATITPTVVVSTPISATLTPVVSPTITPVPGTPAFITPTPIDEIQEPAFTNWPGVYVENTPNHVTRRCPPGAADPFEQCPIIKDGDQTFYITMNGVFPVTNYFMGIDDTPWLCLDDDAQGHTCSVVTAYCYNGVRFGDLYFGTTVEDFIEGERPPIESCLLY